MKFVAAVYGSRGDTEPGIAVARELQRRGHDVRMAVTVAPDLGAYVESAGLMTVPYGRDLLGDEDFTRMMHNPIAAIPQAVEYIAQVVAEKNATLVSLQTARTCWWRVRPSRPWRPTLPSITTDDRSSGL